MSDAEALFAALVCTCVFLMFVVALSPGDDE